MIALRHGSHDSHDVDTLYVFEEKPTLAECQRFCAQTDENRNIIVVRDGVVVECFKGLPDEVNNGLLRTYDLHEQAHACPVARPVVRIIPLKLARGMRVMLTRMTRTPYRKIVKAALRSYDFNRFLAAVECIDFESLSLSAQSLKSVAFQFGQMQGLWMGRELYTKAEIGETFPALAPFMARTAVEGDLVSLNQCRDVLCGVLSCLEVRVEAPVNTFEVVSDGPERLLAQSNGAVCDLAAERCLAMSIGSMGWGLS